MAHRFVRIWCWLRIPSGLGPSLREFSLFPLGFWCLGSSLGLVLPARGLGGLGGLPVGGGGGWGGVKTVDAKLCQVSYPPLVKLESFTLNNDQKVRQVVLMITLFTTHPLSMHVDGKVVLRNPGHVLPGPDVDLGHAIRRILVQDHCEGAGVHTAAHVLLVRSLKCNIPILNLLYLLSHTL